MPIETASFIDGLNSSYPNSADGAEQGDDHIRLIKAVIKATFPNINGALAPTDEQINLFVSRLDALEALPTTVIKTDGTTLSLDATSTADEVRELLGIAIADDVTFNKVTSGTFELTNWTVEETAGTLFFKNAGVSKAKLDATGNLTVLGNITAYGTM